MGISVAIESNIDHKIIIPKRMPSAFWLASLVEWHRLYHKYVPMQSGTLANTVTYNTDDRTITHTVPYARRQYYGDGFSFRTDKNRLAGAQWDQAAKQTQATKLAAFMEGAVNSGRFNYV